MQIRMFSDPEQYIGAVKTSLQRISTYPHPTLKVSTEIDEAQIRSPHEVYDLRADEIAKGKDLTSAHRTAIRYIVEASDPTLIAAEVPLVGSQSVPLIANLNFGRFVLATASGIRDLESHETNGSYVLRLLRFAAIGLMALWLIDEDGKENIVYPLDPAPPPLEAQRLYSEADVLTAIRPMAERRAREQERGLVP